MSDTYATPSIKNFNASERTSFPNEYKEENATQMVKNRSRSERIVE